MIDDASTLKTAWMSDAAEGDRDLPAIAHRVVDKERMQRLRERRQRVGGAVAVAVFVPVLVWASAHGVSPLVREAYGLMAVGCAALVVGEWLYLDWSRRALPGPDDTRSQLQRTAFMLECQAWLARTALVWSSPVFVGVLMISVWLYRERTATAAAIVCAIDLAAWIGGALYAARGASALIRRKRELEDVLADL